MLSVVGTSCLSLFFIFRILSFSGGGLATFGGGGGGGVGSLLSGFISGHNVLALLSGGRYFPGSLLSDFYGTYQCLR